MCLLTHVRCSPAPAGPPGLGSCPHRAPPGLAHGCSSPFLGRSRGQVLATDPLCDRSAQRAAPLVSWGGMNLFLFPSIPVFYSCFAHSSAYSPPPAASLCTHASAAPALLPAAGSCSPARHRPTAHGHFRSRVPALVTCPTALPSSQGRLCPPGQEEQQRTAQSRCLWALWGDAVGALPGAGGFGGLFLPPAPCRQHGAPAGAALCLQCRGCRGAGLCPNHQCMLVSVQRLHLGSVLGPGYNHRGCPDRSSPRGQAGAESMAALPLLHGVSPVGPGWRTGDGCWSQWDLQWTA